MQALINSLTERELNIIASMVDLDCLDYFPTIEQLVLAVEMFNYSEQDIMDTLNSINAFVFEDDFECNCNQHEIDMFFESVSNMDLNYEDDFWFAETQLWNDLLIHSLDTRVGF